jgi:hypothetical protein
VHIGGGKNQPCSQSDANHNDQDWNQSTSSAVDEEPRPKSPGLADFTQNHSRHDKSGNDCEYIDAQEPKDELTGRKVKQKDCDYRNGAQALHIRAQMSFAPDITHCC